MEEKLIIELARWTILIAVLMIFFIISQKATFTLKLWNNADKIEFGL